MRHAYVWFERLGSIFCQIEGDVHQESTTQTKLLSMAKAHAKCPNSYPSPTASSNLCPTHGAVAAVWVGVRVHDKSPRQQTPFNVQVNVLKFNQQRCCLLWADLLPCNASSVWSFARNIAARQVWVCHADAVTYSVSSSPVLHHTSQQSALQEGIAFKTHSITAYCVAPCHMVMLNQLWMEDIK